MGERTEGAANPSDDFAVAAYFRLSIPVMYPEDPVGHSNWEGVGVMPTIPTTSGSALNIAYGMAIDKLLASKPVKKKPSSLGQKMGSRRMPLPSIRA